MGNAGNIGFSNATPYTVKFKIHENMVQVLSKDASSSHSVSVGGSYAGASGNASYSNTSSVKAVYAHQLVDPNF